MIRKDQQGQGRWQAATAEFGEVEARGVEGSNHANVATNPHTWRFSVVEYGCRDRLPLLATIPRDRVRFPSTRRVIHRVNDRLSNASYVGDLQELDECHRQVRAREATASVETSSWLVKRSIIASG